MTSFYAYIMAGGRNGNLYTGSTSDLIKRTWEQKSNVIPGFTAKHNVHILVYYEINGNSPRHPERSEGSPVVWYT